MLYSFPLIAKIRNVVSWNRYGYRCFVVGLMFKWKFSNSKSSSNFQGIYIILSNAGNPHLFHWNIYRYDSPSTNLWSRQTCVYCLWHTPGDTYSVHFYSFVWAAVSLLFSLLPYLFAFVQCCTVKKKEWIQTSVFCLGYAYQIYTKRDKQCHHHKPWQSKYLYMTTQASWVRLLTEQRCSTV